MMYEVNKISISMEKLKREISEVQDEKEPPKLSLPSKPDVLLELTEEQQEWFNYKGDADDKVMRMQHKLFLIWNIWHTFRNNEKLIEICASQTEKDKHKNTDKFVLCNSIVNIIDNLGRTLGLTDLVEELSFTPHPQQNPQESKELSQ